MRPALNAVSTQHDNKAQMFEFVRPEGYGSDDLLVAFLDNTEKLPTVNLGASNELILTSDLTRTTRLQMMVGFRRLNGKFEQSNIAEFTIRDSIFTDVETDPPVLPDPSVYIQSGTGTITHIEHKDDGVWWYINGEWKHSNELFGSGGYAGSFDWSDIQNKPDAFTPAEHKHDIEDITNAIRTVNGQEPDKDGNVDTFEVDETLSFANNRLGVNTTDKVIPGDLRPVTSGGVDILITNINKILIKI